MRGAGPNPYIYRATLGPKARFLGIGLSVPKAGDFETLSRKFGVPIERTQGPGGGSVVHLRDPDGNAVDALHGFTPAAPLPLRAPIPHNAPNQIVRVNDTQRPAKLNRRRSQSSGTSCWRRRISTPLRAGTWIHSESFRPM